MYYKFTSDITRWGPILTPYVLEIDDFYVRYSKRNKSLMNKDKITMPIDIISSVKIDASLIGTTLTITGYGTATIVINKLNIQDAYAIQEILNNRRRELTEKINNSATENNSYHYQVNNIIIESVDKIKKLLNR